MRLNGRHYALPSGSVYRHFVDVLSAELKYFALGQYPVKSCLVFSSVVFQRDKMIRKGMHNIHHSLENHLNCGRKRSLIF